jgi:hypothetical protein
LDVQLVPGSGSPSRAAANVSPGGSPSPPIARCQGAGCLREKAAVGELLVLWGALGCRSRVGRGWLARGGRPSAMRMARNPLRFDGPTL